jgi:hypothetical protein
MVPSASTSPLEDVAMLLRLSGTPASFTAYTE